MLDAIFLIVIVSIFVVLVIYIVRIINRNNKAKEAEIAAMKAANAELAEALKSKGMNIDKEITEGPAALFIDYENRLWSLKEGKDSNINVYKFSDLIEYELIDNDEYIENSLTKVFGGEDALRTELAAQCSYIGFIVKVNDPMPVEKKLDILGAENCEISYTVQRCSDNYKYKIAKAKRMAAELEKILNASS